jgi:hypothetical protein
METGKYYFAYDRTSSSFRKCSSLARPTLVADDHWRAMHWLMRGFFGPEIDRVIFKSFVEMGWVTSEFAKFGREFSASGIWKDPLDRLEPIQGRPLKPETP